MQDKNGLVLKEKSVILKTLVFDDIEKIRIWRNSEEINQFFIYREEISKKQQTIWFKKIDKSKNDYYFSIYYKGNLIGLTEIKRIDWELKTGDAGLFIAPVYQNSLNSFDSTLLLLDFAFDKLKLARITGKVLANNKRALRYNRCFGFKEYGFCNEIIDGEELEIVLLDLNKADYLCSKRKIETIVR